MTSLSSPPLSDSKPDEWRWYNKSLQQLIYPDEQCRRFARQLDDINHDEESGNKLDGISSNNKSDNESDSDDKMANYDSNAGDGDNDSELKYNQQDLAVLLSMIEKLKQENEKLEQYKAAEWMHHPVLLSMIETLKNELKNEKLKNEKLEQKQSEMNDKQKQIAIEINEVNTRMNNGQNEKPKERDENIEELEKTGGGSAIGDNNRKLEDGNEEHGDQAMADTQTLLPQKKKQKVTTDTQKLPPDAALAFGDGKAKGREFKVGSASSFHDHGMRYILKLRQQSKKWDNGGQWFLHKKKGEWKFMGRWASENLKKAQQASGEWKVL